MSDEQAVCGSVRLHHPSGALVTLPVPGVPFDYAGALANVSAALAAGWLVAAPGLEQGEEKEEIGYVLRREKVNADRTETPIIDLYSANDAAKFKVFSVYLNREEDVDAFERASGLRLADLRVFPGTAAPERGANRQSDGFITKAPRPFGIVLKANPKWNPDETDATKKKPKRLFVRWAADAGRPQAAPPQPVAGERHTDHQRTEVRTVADLVNEYRFCADDEKFAYLESLREQMWPGATGPGERTALKKASDAARERLASEPIPF